MHKVYPLGRLALLVAKSSLRHVGAGATSAALRDELTDDGQMTVAEFDELFAASRLTPGTNLLALLVGVGFRLRGFSGAIVSLVAGSLPAAALSVGLCMVYLRFAGLPAINGAVAGASAGAIAVLIWAALRFLWPLLKLQAARVLTITAATLALQSVGAPAVIVLVLAGTAGAMVLEARETR